MRVLRAFFSAVVVSLLASGCSGSSSPTAPSVPPASVPLTPGPTPAPPDIPAADAVIVGAGDIAMCGVPEVEATAGLLDAVPGTVVTLGDNAYPTGTATDFQTCYEPTWGRHRRRTRPAPGNHDYLTAGATAYFDYFGESAGPRGLGYYSYREGAWLILALNSNVPAGPDSAQGAWLRQTLAANPTSCALAYWHHPVFSSGPNGSTAGMRDVWNVLYEAGADVVLAAHDHMYERFAPQDGNGRFDPLRGVRQFTVGTGGGHLYQVRSPQPNSELQASVHGILKLTLKSNSYDWQFMPVPGKSFSDFGTGACH